MPELPEVETVKRTLQEKIVGKVVKGARVFLPKMIKHPPAEEFPGAITGREILGLDRRGKYLLVRLTGQFVMVVHLRMTGRLTYTAPDVPLAKHTHVIFELDDGHELRFQDQRQFGTIYLMPEKELNRISGLRQLGPEPLAVEFTAGQLGDMLAGRKRKVKEVLLDQTFLAGIGNIYADEILFVAGIHPERPADQLLEQEVQRLYEAIRSVLQEGINHRGTTVRDYVDGSGQQGDYQHRLRVYSRKGEPCPRCGQPVIRIKVGGRSSYLCRCCQD